MAFIYSNHRGYTGQPIPPNHMGRLAPLAPVSATGFPMRGMGRLAPLAPVNATGFPTRGMGSLANALRAHGFGRLLAPRRPRGRGLGTMGRVEVDIATLLRRARPDTFPDGNAIKTKNYQTCQGQAASTRLSVGNQNELVKLFGKIKTAATNLFRELEPGNASLVDALNTIPGAFGEQEIVLFASDLEDGANVLNSLKADTASLEQQILETIDEEIGGGHCPLAYGHFYDGRNNMPGWRRVAQGIENAMLASVTELKARRAVASRDIAKVKERIRAREAEEQRLLAEQKRQEQLAQQAAEQARKLAEEIEREERKLDAQSRADQLAAQERARQDEEAARRAEQAQIVAAQEAQASVQKAEIEAKREESRFLQQLEQQRLKSEKQAEQRRLDAEERRLEFELQRMEREEERLEREIQREEDRNAFMLALEAAKGGLIPGEIVGAALAKQIGVDVEIAPDEPASEPGGLPPLPPGYMYQPGPPGPGFPQQPFGFPQQPFGFPQQPQQPFGFPQQGPVPFAPPAFPQQQFPGAVSPASPAAAPVPLPSFAAPQPAAGFSPFEPVSFSPGTEMFGMGNASQRIGSIFPPGVVLDTTRYLAYEDGQDYVIVRKDDNTSFKVPQQLVASGQTVTDKRRGNRPVVGEPKKIGASILASRGISGLGNTADEPTTLDYIDRIVGAVGGAAMTGANVFKTIKSDPNSLDPQAFLAAQAQAAQAQASASTTNTMLVVGGVIAVAGLGYLAYRNTRPAARPAQAGV